MKHKTLLLSILLAVCAAFLADAVPLHKVACLAVAAISLAVGLASIAPRHTMKLANTFYAQLTAHKYNLPQKATAAAIAKRGLLLKAGVDATHVDICGAANVPIGVVDDDGLAIGDVVNPLLLGRGLTKILVAKEALAIGDALYTAAAGKVSKLSATAGTYYFVGYALTATAADGDHVEVNDCIPTIKVVA